ncbi:MAG TPA: hypothetical protein VFD59_01735 [Nocardioidaceae bacterium]|nr:hypothetical protein [Nocardioidaceae bacterium]
MYTARCILGALSIGVLALATAAPVVAAPTDIAAHWEMNEAAEATVMVDSGPTAWTARSLDPRIQWGT